MITNAQNLMNEPNQMKRYEGEKLNICGKMCTEAPIFLFVFFSSKIDIAMGWRQNYAYQEQPGCGASAPSPGHVDTRYKQTKKYAPHKSFKCNISNP